MPSAFAGVESQLPINQVQTKIEISLQVFFQTYFSFFPAPAKMG
ncbi:hypothetical protein B4100_2011 [Heyndrickxia coagulans]|nr:hypothetical protein B4100_2011 [Heyndrickxia coagulans]